MSQGIAISMESSGTDAQAGSTATVGITVRNTGESVGQYLLHIEGLAPSWAQIEPEQLAVFPGQQAAASLRVVVPDNAPTATYAVVVRVSDQAGQGGEAQAAWTLNVRGVPMASSGRASLRAASPAFQVTPMSAPPPQASVAGVPDAALGQPQPGTPASASSGGGQLQISVDRSSVALLAGTRGRCNLQVRNTGGAPLTVDLGVQGLPGNWGLLAPASLVLAPGSSGGATLDLSPVAEAPAGSYPLAVVAQGRDDPTLSARLALVLEIAEPGQLAVSLLPPQAEGQAGAEFQVRVSQQGRMPLQVSLAAQGDDRACDYTFSPASLLLGPDGSADSRLSVRARQRLGAGEARPYPFTVAAHPVGMAGEPGVAQGRYVQSGAPSLQLTLTPPEQRGAERASYTLRVANPSQVPTTVQLSAADSEGACRYQFTPATLDVPANGAAQATLVVIPLAPHDEPEDRPHAFTVTATPGAALLAAASTDGRYLQAALQPANLTLTPSSLAGHGPTRFALLVGNPRAAAADLQLGPQEVNAYCGLEISPQRLHLEPGAQQTVQVVVRPLQKLLPGEVRRVCQFTIQARTQGSEAPATVEGSLIQEPGGGGFGAVLPWLLGAAIIVALVAVILSARSLVQRLSAHPIVIIPTPSGPPVDIHATGTARFLAAAATGTVVSARTATATALIAAQATATAQAQAAAAQATAAAAQAQLAAIQATQAALVAAGAAAQAQATAAAQAAALAAQATQAAAAQATTPASSMPTSAAPTSMPSATPAPSGIQAYIVCPGPNATFRDVAVFRVKAFDPAVGTNDGDGIDHVDMSILDPGNTEVYQRRENTAGYCAFSGGEPNCMLWVFSQNGYKWPNGKAVANGKHTLKAVVNAKNGHTMTLQQTVNIQPAAPQYLVAAIVCAPQNVPAATTDLGFEVETYDPTVGNKDGDGIKSVDLIVLDSGNTQVFKTTLTKPQYCAFGQTGGNAPQCKPLNFAQAGSKWPGGGPQIANGTFTLRAIVHAANGGIPAVTVQSRVAIQIK